VSDALILENKNPKLRTFVLTPYTYIQTITNNKFQRFGQMNKSQLIKTKFKPLTYSSGIWYITVRDGKLVRMREIYFP